LGPDGAFDNVGFEFDEAVGHEAREDRASGDGIAQGLGQLRLREMRGKVCCQSVNSPATIGAEPS